MNEQVRTFLRSLSHMTYAKQYISWQDYLTTLDNTQQPYLLFLAAFLERHPFNLAQWVEYIQLTNHHEYKNALKHNPKSYQLWIGYLQSCKKEGAEKEYKEVLQQAIRQVGADSRAIDLYLQFLKMMPDNPHNKYQFYKKVFTRALVDLQQLHKGFTEWLREVPEGVLQDIATRQYAKTAPSTRDLPPTQIRNILQQDANIVYHSTIAYRDRRLKLESRISRWYFDGEEPGWQQMERWKELLQLEEEYGVIENVAYCYDRWVLAQTSNPQVWQEAFDFMQIKANKYSKVLATLRNNRAFFLSFNLDIAFYWCDLEQREKPEEARKIYNQLVTSTPNYQVHRRWLQFQLRQKQPSSVQTIYQSLLEALGQDVEGASEVVVEYCEFGVRQWKDVEWGRNLLRGQIEMRPFSMALLCKYLQLSKMQQNQEGHYEQLMKDIMLALEKAAQAPNATTLLPPLLKILRHHLRSTLSSIYLIKLSEHRLTEQVQRLTRHS